MRLSQILKHAPSILLKSIKRQLGTSEDLYRQKEAIGVSSFLVLMLVMHINPSYINNSFLKALNESKKVYIFHIWKYIIELSEAKMFPPQKHWIHFSESS